MLHRTLLDDIGSYYERSYIEHSYTSGHGRGPHRAVLRYQGWMRRYRYRLCLDIRRYFPSIHHPTLSLLLFRRLRDAPTRNLIQVLLQAGGEVYRTPLALQTLELEHDALGLERGLPLGSYLSQLCGTFYLDGLDHVVKRDLKIKGYLRYMDDVALFGDDQAELLAARQFIADWLERERLLQLNPKRWHVVPNTAAGGFLGYRVSRSGLSPSRKLRRSLRRRLRLAAAQGHEPLVRSIQSYRGLMLF